MPLDRVALHMMRGLSVYVSRVQNDLVSEQGLVLLGFCFPPLRVHPLQAFPVDLVHINVDCGHPQLKYIRVPCCAPANTAFPESCLLAIVLDSRWYQLL